MTSSGGLSVVRLAWEAFVWLTTIVWPSSGDDVRDDSSYGGDDDDDDSIPDENPKKVAFSIDVCAQGPVRRPAFNY